MRRKPAVEGVLFRADREYRLCPLYEGGPLPDCECEALYAFLKSEYGVDDAWSFPTEMNAWYANVGESKSDDDRPWDRVWWT